MRVRAVALVAGTAFGFMISWAGFGDPDRIRRMLLFEDWYLYPMFVTAVAVGFVGLRLLRGRAALITGDAVAWTTMRPERRHVVGSLIFGAGWAVADACPGPIAAQLGFGAVWSLCTAAGVVAGIALYLRRLESRVSAAAAAAAPATVS